MKPEENIEEIRERAIREISKSERYLKLGIVGIAFYEGALLLLFVLLADWKNQHHQLMFVSTLLVYGTLGLGLVALGAFIKINTNRVLKAIDINRTN